MILVFDEHRHSYGGEVKMPAQSEPSLLEAAKAILRAFPNAGTKVFGQLRAAVEREDG